MLAFANFSALARLLLGATLCLGLTIARASETGTPPTAADPVVMTVNGEAVTAREYRLVMQRHTAAIYGQFARDKKLEDHAGYWSPDTDPDGPLAKLRELVSTELVKIKVRQILGRHYGLVSDASFEAFLKQHDAENARRATAVQAGQVIYGPRHYRLSAYYYLQLRDLEFRLKKSMARDFSGKITDAEIERYYTENEAAFAKKPLSEVRLGILQVLSTRKAAEHLDHLCAEAKVSADVAQLAQLTPRSDPPAAADASAPITSAAPVAVSAP